MPDSGFFDPPGSVWDFAWWRFALEHGLNPFVTHFVDYPSGVNLADQASAPLLAILGIPITTWFGPIATLNFFLMVAIAASASAMYFLVRFLSVRTFFATVAGLLYGFGPYMATESRDSAHLVLAFTPFPPLILLCLVAVAQKRLRATVAGVLIGALSAAQALVDPEVLTSLVLILVIGAVVAGIIYRPRRLRMRPFLVAFAIAAAEFIALLAYPFWFALFGPDHIRGPVQSPSALQPLASDLLGPIVPTSQQFLSTTGLVHISDRFALGNPTESLAYVSLPVLILLAFFAIAFRRDRRVSGALVLALIAFVLSLGSHLAIAGHATSIPLPEGILAHIPLLDSTVPARFALDVILFAAITFAVGLDDLINVKLASRAALARALTLPLSLCACAVFLWPSASTSGAPGSTGEIVAALDSLRPGSVVLTYPFPMWPYSTPMVWQALANMNIRLIGGYSYVQSPFGNGQPYAELLSPPSVQEYLAQAQGGEDTDYPPSPSVFVVESDLCRLIRNYRVSAILDANLGTPNDAAVSTLFRTDLGTPIYQDSSFSYYVIGANSCTK
ncbi:MAG: hypothetical protein WB770_01960 [Acidimicrobiales bacterium]